MNSLSKKDNNTSQNRDSVCFKCKKNKRVIIEILIDKYLDNYFENYEKSNRIKRY